MKHKLFYTKLAFIDTYVMCIFEQLAEIRNKDIFSEWIRKNVKTSCNTYSYDDELNEIAWLGVLIEPFEFRSNKVEFEEVSIIDFLFKIL